MNSPGDSSMSSATSSPTTMSTSRTGVLLSTVSPPLLSPPPPTIARGAARRPPKLRSSCDACGAAKVRCDKTQPRCGRCAAGGITCVYGLSRKFGKAPRKKAPSETVEAADAASKSLAQSSERSNTSLPCYPHPAYRPMSGPTTTRAVKYEPQVSAASSSFAIGENLMAMTTCSFADQDLLMRCPDGLDHFSDPFSFAEAPLHNNAPMRPDPRHHGTVDPLDLTFPSSDYTVFSDWIHPDDLMQTPGPDSLDHAGGADPAQLKALSPHRLSLSTSASSLDSSTFPDAGLPQRDRLHCQRLAHATLESLSLRQGGAQARAGGGTGSHLLTQTMDKVLSRNKQAVENMHQLLRCPCSRSPHLAMLYASITSKILMWYQLAAGCTRPAPTSCTTNTSPAWHDPGFFPPLSSQPTPPLSASSSPSATSASPSNSPLLAAAPVQEGLLVTPMHFSVGAFSVDDEAAHEALRKQLLLSELNKAGALIDLLCLHGRGDGVPPEVHGIYSALGTWLKCELNMTVASLRV